MASSWRSATAAGRTSARSERSRAGTRSCASTIGCVPSTCLRSAGRCLPRLLYNVLNILGPIPLDYEIHDGPGVPLHAHVNARHFTYSNIGGTLNLPSNLVVNRLPSGSVR